MAGKQAKILTRQQVVAALRRARRGRYPRRDRVMILLSVRAGLRAGEIAKLT
jgi:integrase